MKKLTIVIICFENPEELRFTLNSIFCSAFYSSNKSEIDIFIVDGSSTEACQRVVSEFDDKFNDITSLWESDNGIYNAMNKGALCSRSSLIWYINSGDAISAILDIDVNDFNLNSCIFGHSIQCVEGDKYLKKLVVDDAETCWWKKSLPCHQSVIMPREFIVSNKFDETLKISADSKLVFLALERLQHQYFDVVFSEFAIGGVSTNPRNFKQVLLHVREINKTRNRKRLSYLMTYIHAIKKYMFVKLFGLKRYYEVSFSKNGVKKI